MRKWLSLLGLSVIVAPASLSVACNSSKNTNTDTVIKAINNANYFKEIEAGTLANDLISSITVDFLKEKLSEEVKNSLNDSLKVNGITKENGDPLVDNDLADVGTLITIINYKYNESENQTKLTINIKENNQQKVIKAIKALGTFKIEILSHSKVENLKNKINNDFIKAQLDPEIQKIFENNFRLNEITVGDSGQELTDDNLLDQGSLETKIHYNYAQIDQQEAKLTINMSDGADAIIRNINQVKYQLGEIPVGSKAESVKKLINNEFIKKSLNSEIQEIYWNEFSLNRILKDMGAELRDYDLNEIGVLDLKIEYRFAESAIQTTNLVMNVIERVTKKFDLDEDEWVSNLFYGQDNQLYAYSGHDLSGGTIWKIDLENNQAIRLGSSSTNLRTLVQGIDGNLYGYADSFAGPAKIIKFDFETKRFSTLCETEINISSLIQGANGNLYVGLRSNGNNETEIWELNLKTNILIKKYSFQGNIGSIEKLFATSNSFLYLITHNGEIWKINLQDENWNPKEIISYQTIFSSNAIQFSDDKFVFVGYSRSGTVYTVYSFDLKTENLTALFNESYISGIFKNGDKLYATTWKSNRQTLKADKGYDYNIYELDWKGNNNQHLANFSLDVIVESWIWGPENKVFAGTNEGTIFQILM